VGQALEKKNCLQVRYFLERCFARLTQEYLFTGFLKRRPAIEVDLLKLS
jgi:hypothetical protein